MLKRLKGAAVGCAALAIASTALYAAGNYSTYPIVGSASFCVSTIGVNGQAGNTGQGGGAAGTNGAYCAQTVPAGPTTLTGSELIPMDTGLANGAPPQTVTIPSTLLANGFGGTTVATTTGTTAAVLASDAISNYIYAGTSTATYTSFKLPPNPISNQTFCLTNAGTGVLTLSAVAAAANSFGNTPTVTGTTPTSVPVATAVGTAGTVTLSKNCWLYVAGASNTGVWYRVL
jgi:hypothetical protein